MNTLLLRLLPPHVAHQTAARLAPEGWALLGEAEAACVRVLEEPLLLCLADCGRLASDEELALVRAELLELTRGDPDDAELARLQLARIDHHVPPTDTTHSLEEMWRLDRFRFRGPIGANALEVLHGW